MSASNREILRAELLSTVRAIRRGLELQSELCGDGVPPAVGQFAIQAVQQPQQPSRNQRPTRPRTPPPKAREAARRAKAEVDKLAAPKPSESKRPSVVKASGQGESPGAEASGLGAFAALTGGVGVVDIPDLPPEKRPASLAEVRQRLGDCTRCGLHQGRSTIVFGTGSETARVVFVTGPPTADEDAAGSPIAGEAGALLQRIVGAMKLAPDDVFHTSIVFCRPPDDRDPETAEVSTCSTFLVDQLARIQPDVVVTLGRVATSSLLRLTTPITRLRGNWRSFRGIDVMPTLHPRYLMRRPAAKRLVWQDIQDVMKRLGGGP